MKFEQRWKNSTKTLRRMLAADLTEIGVHKLMTTNGLRSFTHGPTFLRLHQPRHSALYHVHPYRIDRLYRDIEEQAELKEGTQCGDGRLSSHRMIPAAP